LIAFVLVVVVVVYGWGRRRRWWRGVRDKAEKVMESQE